MHPLAIGLTVDTLKMMTNLARRRSDQQHAALTAQLQSEILKHMVDAVFTQRIQAVEKICHEVLKSYAVQATDYMKEKQRYTDKIIDTTNPAQRTFLMARSRGIDRNLEKIRKEARLLLFHMGKLFIAMGKDNRNFASDLSAPLALQTSALGLSSSEEPT